MNHEGPSRTAIESASESSQKEMVRQYFAAFAAKDLERVIALMDPNVRLDDPFAAPVVGIESARAFLTQFFSASRFLRVELKDVSHQGGRLFAEFLLEIETGSKRSVITGIDVFRITADGRIAEIKAYVNLGEPYEALERRQDAVPAWPGRESLPPGLTLGTFSTAKRVSKAWGFEQWLVHENAPFAAKLIFIKAGTRTSLQYHREKEELNMLLSGKARLHYRRTQDSPTESLVMESEAFAHVRPNTVHRVEALTDIWLMEVSTTQLDDVVRLEDDWKRADGRIESEHRSSQTLSV